MKLEDRMRQSIRRRSGTVLLRSDVAALGGRTQVSHALDVLLRSGELVRLGAGIYAKAQRESPEGRTRLLGSLETIIREVVQKWGLVLGEGGLPKGHAGVDDIALVVETETPRISRKLIVDGKRVEFRSRPRRPRSLKAKPLAIPSLGVARFVQDLARRYKVVYTPNPLDQWAETVTRLAGDDVRADSTEDLLIALKRAGKISTTEVAALTINHLRERKQRVRSL